MGSSIYISLLKDKGHFNPALVSSVASVQK